MEPRETLLVGDMQHDVETAHHGGVWSCAVLTGYNRLDQLRASRPDLIVEHLGELHQRLRPGGGGLAADGGAAEEVRAPVPTVGGLIFDSSGRMLLVRTRKWSDLWGIPGGKIEYGESSEAALRRELLEETGLELADIRFVMLQDCVNSPEFYRQAHFLLLNYVCRMERDSLVRLNGEAQAHAWVTWDEATALPLNGPTRRLLEHLGSTNDALALMGQTVRHG
jgi:ADP-ribose pyrophosphatase YjhB (NUDIX family)